MLEKLNHGSESLTFTRHIILQLSLSLVSGGIYIAAWNYKFGNAAERAAYYGFSIALLAIPLLLLASVLVQMIYSRDRTRFNKGLLHSIVMVVIPLRAGIFFISLVNLAKAPAGVYQDTTWSRYLPHIG